MRVRFTKMQGCGNDFVVLDARGTVVLDARDKVVLDAREAAPLLDRATIVGLADRRRGIGCDQLIVLEPPRAGGDVFMRIHNPDGSEAGACGNATRCVARLVGAGRRVVTVETVAGLLPATLEGETVTVDMGAPRLGWRDVPLARAADTLHLPLAAGMLADPAALSMGNPHATFFVDDADAVPLAALGPVLEHDALFPERANIGVASPAGPGRLRLRVWERGAGLTPACGSGACAALVNAARRGLAGREAALLLDGGTLRIAWRGDGHVLMTGPAETSFTGEVEL